jgi:hypothetical protein
MDPILSVFLSWQFIMFSLGIYVITWMMRTLLEYKFPKVITSKFYSEIILPFTPVFVGAIVAFFATQYAYPAGIGTLSGRLLFGSVSGLLSGTLFRVIKAMLKSKLDPDDNFIPAPPPPPNAPPPGVMGQGIR